MVQEVKTTVTPAQGARLAAGLTVKDAAKRARICEAYLRRIERHGAPYALARRLAALYQCPIDLFLPPPREEGSKTPHTKPAGRGRSHRQGPRLC